MDGVRILVRWFRFGNRVKRGIDAPFPQKLVEMGAILEGAAVDVKGTTTTSMLLYSKARRCNGAGKLEASKVLAAAANGTSPADEGEILSSFRGKTVDFPRTRNYFLAFAPLPIPPFHARNVVQMNRYLNFNTRETCTSPLLFARNESFTIHSVKHRVQRRE